MKKKSLIYVAYHQGFLGSAIVKKLKEAGYKNILSPAAKELDLLNQEAIVRFFRDSRPEYVFLPPIKSGGILINTAYPADFIYQNLVNQTNLIHSAFKYGVKKLLFLGSACSYPKICRQPIKEEYLLTGPVEATSEPYAVAKIAGIKMCQAYNKQYKTNFICAIPTNVYGPGDDFEKEGHVIAGLVERFYKAAKENSKKTEIKVWGTGKPKREFLYIDDFAEASIFLMENYNGRDLINISGGKEVSIKKLANMLKGIAGLKGKIVFEKKKPDGIPRRILDSSRIFALGWRPKINLEKGLKFTYNWYKNNFPL